MYVTRNGKPTERQPVQVESNAPLVSRNTCYWDCQKLRQKLCTARKVTVGEGDNVEVTKSSPHDHPPDREVAEAEVVKYNLKWEQKEDLEKIPSAILRKVLPRTSSGVIAHLPDRRNLARSMRTGRKKSQPGSPSSLEELKDIPETYQKTRVIQMTLKVA